MRFPKDDTCYLKWSVGFAKVHLQEIDPEGDLNQSIDRSQKKGSVSYPDHFFSMNYAIVIKIF